MEKDSQKSETTQLRIDRFELLMASKDLITALDAREWTYAPKINLALKNLKEAVSVVEGGVSF